MTVKQVLGHMKVIFRYGKRGRARTDAAASATEGGDALANLVLLKVLL